MVLILSCLKHVTMTEDIASSVTPTSDSISDVKIWMNGNRLTLNYDKTEFIIIGSKIKKLPGTTNNINGHMIANNKRVNILVSSLIMICPCYHILLN